ncbi:MAG: hypothetical protein QXV09_00255 [Candidatus Bathyarchaeia archaeon]
MTNVIQLDLTKYNMTLKYHEVLYPAEFGGIAQEEVRYILKTNGSELDVTFVYRNAILAFVTIYIEPVGSAVHYIQPKPTNLITAAKDIVERYHEYTGSSRYKEMANMLNQVGNVENTTVAVSNLKLKIYAEGQITAFQWLYMFNGLEKPGLELVFRNGQIETFNDQWNLFKVGSTTIKVSQEEAIGIAREQAKNFSWKVGLDADAAEVKEFTVLEAPVKAELSMQAREPLTLYPFWRITLYLDKTYPGGVIGIVVGVWADTGEVRYIEALSYGGAAPPEDTSTIESTLPAMDVRVIAVATATIIATAALAAVILQKKRSK